MNLVQLKKIVAKGEGDHIEFKKSTSLLEDALKTVCAFLNCGGGVVFIGVGDKGKIIGQEISDATCREIAQKISKLEPSAQSSISIDYVPMSEKNKVIAISIDAGPHIPYVYDGRPYQRIQNTTSKMPQHQYEQLIVKRGQLNHSWESVTEPGYSVNDLDHELISNIIKKAIKNERLEGNVSPGDIEDFLYRFRLLQDGSVTRAALLMFCKDVKKQFIQSQLRIARFRGTDKNEFIDNKTYIDNIFNLYDRAMTFFDNYLPISGKITEHGYERIDIPAIPNKVLREVLVNALCHRDYSIAGGAVSVAIYDDRVEVSSTGVLPPGMHMANLLVKHRSNPRNPLIAAVLYTVGYIERWGRGIEKIINLSKDAGNPEPHFEETDVDINVCLPLKEPILSGAQAVSSEKLKISLNARQDGILRIIKKHGVINIKNILLELKNQVPQRTVQYDLAKLKKFGLIESKGKGQSVAWMISKKTS